MVSLCVPVGSVSTVRAAAAVATALPTRIVLLVTVGHAVASLARRAITTTNITSIDDGFPTPYLFAIPGAVCFGVSIALATLVLLSITSNHARAVQTTLAVAATHPTRIENSLPPPDSMAVFRTRVI